MSDKLKENAPKCATQNEKAKSEIVNKIARLVRREGIDYEDWRYISRRVREACKLKPAKKPKRLPRILNADDFRRFYREVDQANDVQHSLMLRLLFYTGVRVSELCNIRVGDVDVEGNKIVINQGKNSKDRFVLFNKSFGVALRSHIAAHPNNRYLFQTKRHDRYSTRRIQQIVREYARRAGVEATPHSCRHMCITWLTKHSGLADAELQLITGHAQRNTLQIYQHLAVDGEVGDKYQQAMKEIEL